MEEQGQALPAVAWWIRLIWHLDEPLHAQTSGLQSIEVVLKRPVTARESHAQSVAFNRIGVESILEIRPADDERRIQRPRLESARRVEGVHDGDAQVPIRLEDAARFLDGPVQVVHVV